jgi:hypothetical protein
MATVPGVPDHTIPTTFAPTQADMLMAAAIMHQHGRFAQEELNKPVKEKKA